ncbi:hypothetical protein ACROYT_G042360 [Oculina patagonica]
MNPDRVGRIPPPTRRLVVRKANSHRDLRPLTERATLDKVLGLTVTRNASLACDPLSGVVAYPAGCVVVLFNPRKNKQSFVLNTSKKTITSVAFSGDGKYLATGESGHMPCVRIWDMEDQSHPQISEMAKGHKFGISCVAFSPNLKYVASVGFQHDMIVNIWNWKTGTKVASNKVSSKVSALSFSENGSYFVTVGVRHVKFWYFDTESNKSKVSKTLVINGRAALLGEQRNNTFCDVACGRGINSDLTYCVSSSGLLCSINSKRVLDTWVELKTSKARAIAVSEHYIICGCADGIIRVFNPLKLQFIVTIPKPHFLGVNVAEGIDSSNPLSKPEKAVYPDTVAVVLDTVNHRLTCVYNDHSLYMWDVKDMKKIGKTWSSLYHSTCVWGVEVYPNVSDNRQAALPPGSFLTCSSDDTVRVWNIEEGTSISFERNVYSKEMMKVLYMEDALANLKDTDISPAIKNMRDSTGDTRNAGVRCLRISPDGQTLATGDRSGNIRVYDLMFFDETAKIEAHESEVLCVEFSPTESGHKLLGSAGRDRLIHVFDIQNNFVLVQTLDDHSASITSIKFNMSESDELQLLSCGADKSIIFRTAQQNPEFQFVRTTNFVGKTTFYDMDIDPSGKHAATSCQDRNVRVYDVSSGKQTRMYKGTPGDDGTLVRITLDSSGTYAATSCSDKSVCLTEFDSGECMASMSGHSEVVTGLKFSVDCKNLISVGGDGCIFLWKIPTTYVQNMVEKLQPLGIQPDNKVQFGTPIRRETYQISHPPLIEAPEENDFVPAESSAFTRPTREPSPPVKDYRFSVGQLPAWAKKQLIAEGNEKSLSPEQDNTGPIVQPGGRWAQRMQNGGIHVAADNGTVQPIPFSLDPADRKRYTIEPISLQEQVRALANSPLERRCSLTYGEDDDLFPADGRAALDKLSEEENGSNEGDAPPCVTVSRGSDVMPGVIRKSSLVVSETEELKFEEAEELDEEEMKEVIIYLPPSQDDFDSEVASAPRVHKIVHHYEALQLSHHQSCPNIAQQVNKSLQDDLDEQETPVKLVNPDTPAPLNRSPSLDYLPSRLQTFLRSFQLSAAQRPKRLSLTVEDPKGEELESKDKVGEKERKSPSSEDDEDEVVSPSEDTKPFGEDENKSDDEEIVGRYFETLGTSSPAPKVDEQITEPPPLDTDRLMRTRLSISARFLSRSHQPGRTGAISTNLDEEKSDNHYSSSDDTKQDLQRRKEEMAQAVEATRKRLEALGWKAKEDILKKLPTSTTAANTTTATSTTVTTSVSSTSSTTVTVASRINTVATSVLSTSTTAVTVTSKTNTVATSVSSTPTSSVTAVSKTNTVSTSVSSTPNTTVIAASKTNVATSVSFTPNTAVTAASSASKDGDSTPVSSLTESSSKPAVITNLLETRLADVQQNHKVREKEHTEKKEFHEAKKENDKKDEDTDKSKRTASHLIAFFSQSKSPKNKDKEKENAKEKEKTKTKDKDKEKGRATPPPGKQTSDAKSAPGGKLERRGSEGKSWRKSLGILGGSSKHDKEEKHNKRHSDPRVSTPHDVVTKNSQTTTAKHDEKADKSNKKQTETRSSTPPVDFQSGTAKHGERTLKTVKEEKEQKSTKPQPERRSSNPTAELALKNSQARLKTSETATSSSKNVPLREKKGRVTSDERREKSRSLGDIDKRLHAIGEVSILDPSVPPSRTVDTMDIPDQVKTGEKRPKSSAALLETTPLTSNTPLERKPLDMNGVLGMNSFKENSNVSNGTSRDDNTLKNTSSAAAAASNGENSTELKPALDKKKAPAVAGSSDKVISAAGSTAEKRPKAWSLDSDIKTTSKTSSPAKSSRSGSGASFMSDISELSAELSAAIASPPPEPIRLSMSEANLLSTSPPSGSRRSPIGKDHDGACASDATKYVSGNSGKPCSSFSKGRGPSVQDPK